MERKQNRANSKLSITKIVELVYEYLYSASTITQITQSTGRCRDTVVEWLSLRREVSEQSIAAQPNYVGLKDSLI